MSYRDALDAYAERSDGVADRVRARLARGPAPRRPTWIPALVAVAAGAVLVVPWLTRPDAVERDLVEEGEATLGDHVRVRWAGTGSVRGDTRDLAFGWEAGRLALDIDPGVGVDLRVRTAEADVRVVGTVFDLRRDAFGTTVTVDRGTVAVRCVDPAALAAASPADPADAVLGPEARLHTGDEQTCLPVTPAALLGRARAQLRRGDAPDAVLATLARGLQGAEGALADELGLLQAAELARAGRSEEALATAERTLATGGGTRALELRRLATRLAETLGGCERARTHADALLALGEPTACAGADGPGR